MIDLRSDTVTRPTEAMLETMREASLGDDSRDGDPTVRRLEELAATRTGKEAAAFMPSGTMTNLVAVLSHTQRGGEVLLEAGSHILNSELGGITAVAGAFYKGIPGSRGAMDVDRLAQTLRTATRQNFGTALVCMETSHNRAGGAVLPLAHMQAVREVTRKAGVPVHIDGARVFNAAVALKTDAASIAQHGDSIAFCVSKGLSAPVGSLLCGSGAFVERARAFRRMVGGNMRQAGPLAAAGIVALETMTERLVDDHRRARRLAEALADLFPGSVDPATIRTNIVCAPLRAFPPDVVARLGAHGVRCGTIDARTVRFATHVDVDDGGIEHTICALRTIAGERS
jgi:threonine aldolase